MIAALVHGNEWCGAWALASWLRRLHSGQLRVRRGALLLALCNLEAFDAFDPAQPHDSRLVGADLNRLWGESASSPGTTPEHARRDRLRPWVEAADWLLDLHSMHEPGPPTVLPGLAARHLALASRLATPALVVIDGGHAAGARMRDHGRFGKPGDAPDRSLLVECGGHFEPRSARVALGVSARFAVAAGSVEARDLPAPWLHAPVLRQQLFDVTHVLTVRQSIALAEPWMHGQMVERRGTLLGHDGETAIVTPYDDCLLVMPSLRHAKPGATWTRLARAR